MKLLDIQSSTRGESSDSVTTSAFIVNLCGETSHKQQTELRSDRSERSLAADASPVAERTVDMI